MKLLIPLVMITGLVSQAFAEEETSETLQRQLKDLYVIHTPTKAANNTTENLLEVFLTLNSYQGEPGLEAIVDNKYKYVIYVADEEQTVLRTFEFLFGGPSQFAVRVSGEEEVFVGKVGEYVKGAWFRGYAGLRADPAFYDQQGYRDFVTRRCLPKIGFRCEGSGDVQNYFQDKNVLALGLSLNAKSIHNDAGSSADPTRFLVWAKAFREKD